MCYFKKNFTQRRVKVQYFILKIKILKNVL